METAAIESRNYRQESVHVLKPALVPTTTSKIPRWRIESNAGISS